MMQAFFTASEMALTSANRIKLKDLVDSGDATAIKLDSFLKKEGVYLGTTLVGTNIAVVVSAVLATRIFAEYFGPNMSALVATLVMVPTTLIFAEIVPKMIARQFATVLALRMVIPLSEFYRLFHPLIVSVNAIARFIISPLGRRKTGWDMTLTKSDLKRILLFGHETGGVEADKVELIHKVLDFEAKKVERIMVPMEKISSISMDDTTGSLKKLVSLKGFSRTPVYEKNKNNIVGIVNIYDILFTKEEDDNAPIKEFVRDPVYLRKSDGLDIALTRLRHKKQPMGIVLDEEGKTSGIITIEDMLEEIVGEIEDTG